MDLLIRVREPTYDVLLEPEMFDDLPFGSVSDVTERLVALPQFSLHATGRLVHTGNGSMASVLPRSFCVTTRACVRGCGLDLRFKKPGAGVLEDFYMHLLGIPPLLASTREALLR